MRPALCTERRHILHLQHGTTLLEALITLAVMAILGIGLAYITGRATVAQRYMNSQNLSVIQMRNILQTATTSSCASTTTISIASSSISTPCSISATSYTVTALNASGTTIASGSYNVSYASMSTAASDTNASILLGGQIAITP